jgi:uncharacterized protein YdgA (DUF945 family)
MRKGLWLSVAIVAALAATYPGLAWYSGKTVEARLKTYQERMLAQAPYLTVASRTYERGIYRSSEEITYEFGRGMFAAIAAAAAASGKPSSAPGSVTFTVRSRIVHGPLPGFGPPALARIDTEFVMSDAVKQALAKAFGERKPIEIVTLLDFQGGGETKVSSPAFDGFSIGVKGETLSWKGLNATVKFGPDLAWAKLHGEAPGMEVKSPAGESAKFEQISLDSNSQLAFEDLYIGDASATVKSVRVEPGPEGAPGPQNMSMDGLAYSARIDRKEEFLDVGARFGIASMDVQPAKLSDLHYDLTLKHLHGPTLAALMRTFRKTLAEGAAAAGGAGDEAFAKELRRVGVELLKRDPELVIDRISFAMPEGDAKLSGNVRLVGFDEADLDGAGAPMALVQKLDARIDAAVSEALLEKLVAAGGGAAQWEQQLAAFEEQGYVTRADGRLSTRIEFRQGALTLNGKAFTPPSPPPPAGGKPPRDTTHT